MSTDKLNVLDLSVLTAVEGQDDGLAASEIAEVVVTRLNGVVNPSTPTINYVLGRLEEQGCVKVRMGETNRSRGRHTVKRYQLTKVGSKKLVQQREAARHTVSAVRRLLR